MSMAEVFPPKRDPAEGLPNALESRLATLTELVSRLETRVAALESVRSDAPMPLEPALSGTPLPPAAAPVVLPGSVRFMGLLGRTCLILGGATFIRALVDASTIHRGWGVALGLAYAITWGMLADRARQPLDAGFHALASILITYPLIVESTARFGILPPGLAAFLLLTATCLHGAVAWRRELQPIMWIATFASLGSGLALMATQRTIEPFLTVFLVLGIATFWATQGRKWQGLRWPTALAANLGVLILTSLATWHGGTPEAYRGLQPAKAMGFALALALLFIGSFALRLLQQRCVVKAFEVTQTILVLLVGCGGALRVALASGSAAGLLGAGFATAGAGCYAAAIPFAEDRAETRANFHYFSFLALSFLLLGGAVLLPLPVFAPLAGALGLGSMLAGLRLHRPVLILQSGLYLLAAALSSGLTLWTFRAFLSPAGLTAALPLSGSLSLACLAMAVAVFVLRPLADPVTAKVRPVVLLLGAATAGGLGALAIHASMAASTSGPADPGALAAVRTGVLSALALLLAWCGRRFPALELRWLVYPLLIVTTLKFLFEDLAVGRALTLFAGFMCFGATLMFAPRLLKAPAAPARGADPNPHPPEVDP
jgi:hypothetical protein